MQVYSFVAQTNTTSYSGDVKNFFNYLRDNKGYNAAGQYVLSESPFAVTWADFVARDC